MSADGIAIIGMAGRFPGARSVGEFWKNLLNGVESITHFTAEELEAGGDSSRLPNFVRAHSVLDDEDKFDAGYFGIFPKEAEAMDPQHRVFLECSAAALDDAGYDPFAYDGSIGVYAGCSPNTYFLRNLCADADFIERYTAEYQVGNYQTMLGTSPDFLPTRVAYKLNLRGPAIFVGTACSTSLVAASLACESLLNYQCDMSLAGGVSITFPQKRGYLYQEGGIVSADGHCRAFDADARGTVFGSGCGVVLLKRLEDAIADGDHIYAVIRGFALNNDGSAKAGFTAPGIDGQAQAIAMAQEMAGIHPETIGYIEAHGTGTPLGDPIEVAALTQAFRAHTEKAQFCAIGTAKTNVGHLDAAAGVTGLIKTALALKHGVIPASLNYRNPNPRIDFAGSPFYVNDRLSPWPGIEGPRRAAVSAFGVGGTNSHVVLEQAPDIVPEPSEQRIELLPISARSASSLEEARKQLVEHLKANPALDLADAAFTLQTGRRAFDHRGFIVAPAGIEGTGQVVKDAAVAFLFPGQGSQYAGMTRELYEAEPVYRDAIDRCAAILAPHIGCDLRTVLFGADSDPLNQTVLTQPALFTVEYALAQLWLSLGIRPVAMLGHSVGEFVAACLGGVFTLEDALMLIAKRGRLMQDLPGGSMMSVRLPEAEMAPLLSGDLSIAAINSPNSCVVAGETEKILELQKRLEARNVVCRILRTSHAFHSPMMDPIIEPFIECVRQVKLSAPQMPYLSGVTGEWITAAQATDPIYWARHFREPVRFSEALRRMQEGRAHILVEVGPGRTLTTLARQHFADARSNPAIATLGDTLDGTAERVCLMTALGRLWVLGLHPNWGALHAGDRRRRVPLPSYPFERSRYWVNPPSRKMPSAGQSVATEGNPPMTQPSTVTRKNRADRLKTAVQSLFEELAGANIEGADESTTFLEMGFDSLFLTQAAQSIQQKFGTAIRFAQLLDEQSTFATLAGWIDSQLAPGAFEEPEPASAPVAANVVETTAAAASAPIASSGLEALLREQMQTFNALMNRQFELLNAAKAQPPADARGSVAPPAASATAAPKPVETPQAHGPFKPINKAQASSLTAAQQNHLDSLVDRYTERTKGSKALAQRFRATLCDPRAVAGFRAQWKEMVYPIVVERSKGSKLWDVDGNEYIDLLNGYGVTMLGHAPDFVQEAVAKQVQDGFQIGPQSPLAGRVAALISELTGMERVTFCNTGSEAVMAALRVARTVTGRNKIVYFNGDYHGTIDEVLLKAGKRADGEPIAKPIAPGIPLENAANAVILQYGSDEALDYIRRHANEIAAVLLEPVQSRHPHLQPIEFLRELRAITEQSGSALIFDEVVTGFRCHPGGAQALFGIRADMATYGKVIGGGLPIGVLAGASRFMDALDGGLWQYGDDSFPEVGVTFFAGTFVRHPLAMAAAHAVLTHLKESGPELQEKLSARAGELVERLNDLFAENEVPAHIENFASILYFSFPPEQRFASLLWYHLRARGIHIQEGFPCFLTTAHSDEDLDRVVEAFRDGIREMQEGEFLPAPAGVRVASGPVEAPLTEAQMEIRLSAQLGEEESCAYNEGFTIEFRGVLNEAALRHAFDTVVSRHEALRATLSESGETLICHPDLRISLPLIDLSNDPDQPAALARMKAEDARQHFDLIGGPLVRAHLVRLSAQDHVLFVTAHHIICDGWSTNVILGELSALYTAACEGTACELPEPAAFSEYAWTEKRLRRADEAQKVEAYWVNEFAKPAPLLDLPTDRPRPALKSYRGDTFITRIDRATCDRIRKAGAQKGSTLFGTMLTGFNVLLSRLARQADIVVGIPAAAQSKLTGGPLVGHCVNFLPIRMSLDGAPTGADLLAQCRRKLIEANEHQSYTYGTLVRRLALPRDPGRLPLIEVQFNLEKVGSNMKFGALEATVEQNPKAFVNFDIFLSVTEERDGLTLYCYYNSDLFDELTIARWLSHYRVLLEGMADNVGMPVSRLPILGAAERDHIVAEWNATSADYPRHASVHDLFEAQAARVPANTAVTFGSESLSYAELNHRADALAFEMQSLGLKPGALAGICLEPSIEMLVAVLAVLKSGGAYVPLDPSYPSDRIEFIIEDSALAILLTTRAASGHLNTGRARVCFLDEIEMKAGAAPRRLASADTVAYVMYTSGSTGKPKGVEVTHGNVVNFLKSMQREPGLTEADRLLAVTTLSFDIAGLELLLPLSVGGLVVIAGREVTRDGRKLAGLISSAGITAMQATPSTWKLLLEAEWAGQPNIKLMCGGEELPRELANALVSRCASLWNMYGPTETTIWSSVLRIEQGIGPVPVGRPIANTQFYVLDAYQQPVPVGVPGELYIGGDGVARGYLNRPELTREKFLANPFVNGADARMYRTGDLVRYRPDGLLDFLGRLDYQVKIRGHRIELGEIEALLETHPALKDSAVVAREDDPGVKRLVGYVVPSNRSHAIDTHELKRFLSSRLPDYMVPSVFVTLEGAMPVTPNGKTDRRALLAMPSPGRVAVAEAVAPRNETEKTLAAIWTEVLHAERVGIHDDLFDLGADSIHVFQICARCSRAGLNVQPRDLLRRRTVAELAETLAPHAAAKQTIARVSREAYRNR